MISAIAEPNSQMRRKTGGAHTCTYSPNALSNNTQTSANAEKRSVCTRCLLHQVFTTKYPPRNRPLELNRNQNYTNQICIHTKNSDLDSTELSKIDFKASSPYLPMLLDKTSLKLKKVKTALGNSKNYDETISSISFTIWDYWNYRNLDPSFRTPNADQSQTLISETTKNATLDLKTSFQL